MSGPAPSGMPGPASSGPSPRLVVRHAQVWDGESTDLRAHDVLCEDGLVRSLEPAGSIRPGPQDTVLEADGAALLPGLVDAHVHLVWSGGSDPAAVVDEDGEQLTAIRAAANAGAHVRAGVTTVADLGSNWDVAISVARAAERGHLVGPRILAAGRTVAMTGGHDPFWVNPCDGVDAVVRGVRQQAFLGAGIIKTAATGGVYGRAEGEEVGAGELTYEELAALTHEAHRRGLKVTAHALGTEGIRDAVRAGVDIIQHGVFLTEEIVADMAERGTVLSPTLAVYRSIAEGGGPAYAAAKATEVVRAHADSVRMALAAGVPVIAGTDAGSPGMPHPSLAAELACLQDVGLGPVDVLRAATSASGDALSRPVGRIVPGTVADLLVVAGDPLADPVAAASPTAVVSRQRVLTPG
ncbi:metal-dependent hydrolase family protein [Serinicoccus sp. LYQ131]|uniref:metal-dependent hydrolase family protein n=1 Tax=Serinicoccus sp. LYQ131 TaxID=3378797 RepID=UPI003853CE96